MKKIINAIMIALTALVVFQFVKFLQGNQVENLFLSVGLITVMLYVAGTTKKRILDMGWYEVSPDQPFTWWEKVTFPFKWAGNLFMFLMSGFLDMLIIFSMFLAGPLFVAISIIGIDTLNTDEDVLKIFIGYSVAVMVLQFVLNQIAKSVKPNWLYS